jgi:taurine--2-oxoglutarate transaminase
MTSYPFFFTWTDQKSAAPMALTGGEGVYFRTDEGGEWLDMGSLSYQANLGHGHRGVIEAIKAQADSLCLAMPDAVYPAKLELARRLLDLAPAGFDRVLFTLGGAEAIENAIKIARLVTGRHKLLSRYRSYHGATMGAISLSGDWRRAPVEPGLPGVVHAMDCYCDRCPFGKTLATCARECATHIGDVLDLEGPRSVAAVVLEPVVGANGVLIPPPEYWPLVRSACDRHGSLLIADEVLTGFGRTGRCFGFEHFDVIPDMITVAKGLTAGYAPLGAVLVHERVSAHFDDAVLACGLTNYAHPLGCAAALATLHAYRDEDLFARAAALEPVLLAALRELGQDPGLAVRCVRGVGLLAAIELEIEPASWQALSAALSARKLFVHVYARRGTVIFAPPLCIDQATLCHGIELFAGALREALAGPRSST